MDRARTNDTGGVVDRNQPGIFVDLSAAVARLPWQAGVGLAPLVYYFAGIAADVIHQLGIATDLTLLKAIYEVAWALTTAMQHAAPLLLLAAAALSALYQYRYGKPVTDSERDIESCPHCGTSLDPASIGGNLQPCCEAAGE